MIDLDSKEWRRRRDSNPLQGIASNRQPPPPLGVLRLVSPDTAPKSVRMVSETLLRVNAERLFQTAWFVALRDSPINQCITSLFIGVKSLLCSKSINGLRGFIGRVSCLEKWLNQRSSRYCIQSMQQNIQR